MKERRLLIDDERTELNLFQMGIKACRVDVIARNFWEGLTQIRDNGPWDVLYLDHDLQSFDKENEEWTGYEIMCEIEALRERYTPKKIICVSSNPSGKKRIEQVIKKLGLE